MRLRVNRIVVLAVTLFVLGSPFAGIAGASDQKVKWDDVIGIIQAGNLVGSGTGQVTGGGQPWSTLRGKAEVDLENGHVKFSVEGLVLAGGNGIGTPGTITQVKGTLVCDTNGSAGGGNSTLVDTPLVPLSAEGDPRRSLAARWRAASGDGPERRRPDHEKRSGLSRARSSAGVSRATSCATRLPVTGPSETPIIA